MDIEKQKRESLASQLVESFHCIQECNVRLIGFDENLRVDLIALSRFASERWVLAFEIKEPTVKWELKNWLNFIRQAANYPNCRIDDRRAGSFDGSLIHASFIYPTPTLAPWNSSSTQANRFYREHDVEPLRGALFLAQHFRTGTVVSDENKKKIALKLGADPVWDNRVGFRSKSNGLLGSRKIGSLKRKLGDD